MSTMTLWESPGGILHRRQRCSGNGQRKKTRKVRVTRDQYDQAFADRKVCRCVGYAGGYKEEA
jgi:hypothetical protein